MFQKIENIYPQKRNKISHGGPDYDHKIQIEAEPLIDLIDKLQKPLNFLNDYELFVPGPISVQNEKNNYNLIIVYNSIIH